MNSEFEKQFEVLLEKLAELVTGDSSPEMVAKVKIWAIYNHIHKSMPNLTGHWSQNHPEGRAEIRGIFEEIRNLNQALKAKQDPPE
jgi:hypothetical protein